MMAVLRDHADRDLPTGPEPLPTLCMHARPGFPGETAAAMVAHLRPGKPRELTATVWTAFGSPCLSIFRPVYPFAGGLPPALDIGRSGYSPDSPWWVFERLQRLVAVEPSLAGEVRSAFGVLQQRFFDDAEEAENRAERAIQYGRRSEAIEILRALVDSTTDDAIAQAAQLLNDLENRDRVLPIPEMLSFWAEINEQAGVPTPQFVLTD
jgi:dipeptidase